MNETIAILQESETEQIKKSLEAIKHPNIAVDIPNIVVVNKYSSDPNIDKHPLVHVKVTPSRFECQVIYVRDRYKRDLSPITFEKIQTQIRAIKEMLEPDSISVEFDEDVRRYIQDETAR